MKSINDIIEEILQIENERINRSLSELITNYDFIVGSVECKAKLMVVLPEAATIVCTPYIDNPNMVYVVRKFDIMDLIQPHGRGGYTAAKESKRRQNAITNMNKRFAYTDTDALYIIENEEV